MTCINTFFLLPLSHSFVCLALWSVSLCCLCLTLLSVLLCGLSHSVVCLALLPLAHSVVCLALLSVSLCCICLGLAVCLSLSVCVCMSLFLLCYWGTECESHSLLLLLLLFQLVWNCREDKNKKTKTKTKKTLIIIPCDSSEIHQNVTSAFVEDAHLLDLLYSVKCIHACNENWTVYTDMGVHISVNVCAEIWYLHCLERVWDLSSLWLEQYVTWAVCDLNSLWPEQSVTWAVIV